MIEEWKQIKGFENYYISNFGNVKHIYDNGKENFRKIAINKKNGGYKQISLTKKIEKNKYLRQTFKIHRLVAETFIPNPNNYSTVIFKDKNKNNCCVENLEWGIIKCFSKEQVFEETKKYKTRTEFQKKRNRMYELARLNNWLDDMIWLQRKANPYIDQMDNVYCYKFVNLNSVYIGRTIQPTARNLQHRNHSNSSVFKFAKEHNVSIPEMEIIESNLSLEQGLELEDFYINKFRNEGWNILNKAKTGVGSGSLGGCTKKWTYQKCYETALKYIFKNEFRKNEESAYNAAIQKGWLKDFVWLKNKEVKKIYQFSLEGDFLKEWPTAGEIKRELGYNKSLISACCKNIYEKAYGFIWRYEKMEGTN